MKMQVVDALEKDVRDAYAINQVGRNLRYVVLVWKRGHVV